MERCKWFRLFILAAFFVLPFIDSLTIDARELEVPDPNAALENVIPTGESSAETVTQVTTPVLSQNGAESENFDQPITGTVEVDTSLRVRTGVWGNVISGLRNGAKVDIIGKEGDFYKITWGDGTAYVHQNYVSIPGKPATQVPAYPPKSGAGGISSASSSSTSSSKSKSNSNSSSKTLPKLPSAGGATVGATKGDGTAKGALNWALDQLPGGNRNGCNLNNGKKTKDDPAAWNNWCLAFVATAWGRKVPELQAPSAIVAYKQCKAAGKIVNDRNPPAGAALFQDVRGSNQWGHIFIATGEKTASGDPIIITTGWSGYNGIHRITLSEMEAKYRGKYLGWAKLP